MNRAWIVRAEQRIARLEALATELKARIAELEAEQPEPEPALADGAVKRGPGRPRKVEVQPS